VLKNSFTGTGIWPDEKVGRSDRSIIDDRHPADGFVTLKNRQADKLKEFFNTIRRQPSVELQRPTAAAGRGLPLVADN
jgi:hypothetical protein